MKRAILDRAATAATGTLIIACALAILAFTR